MSVRALAKRHHVHRRTVRQALASAAPPEPARRRWQSRKIDLLRPCDRRNVAVGSDGPAQAATHHGADPGPVGRGASGDRVVVFDAAGHVAQRRREIWVEAGRPLAECSSRRRISRPPRVRSTSPNCGWICPPAGRSATCSRCGCASRVGRCIGCSRLSRRRRSSRVISPRSPSWVVFQRCTKYDNLKSAVSAVLFGNRPAADRERAVGAVPFALPIRWVLLPARRPRSPRKGRCGGRRRPAPAQPSGPGAEGEIVGRAECSAGQGGPGR